MPELEITAMTLGPFGIGHLKSKTVLVPGTAVADLIEVTLVEEHGDYAVGRLKTLKRPGPARRTPPCPYLPQCGGCDWQHIDYMEQVRLKAQLIAEKLGHALGVRIDPGGLLEPGEPEFGYRSRIRLQVSVDGQLGFYRFGSNAIVPIKQCLVASPRIRMPVALASALGRRCAEIEVAETGAGEVLVAGMSRAPEKAELDRARRVLQDDPAIAGIVIRGGGKREVLGDATVHVELEPELILESAADLFTQTNHSANRKLVSLVMELAGVAAESKVLDLFCGAGNFSLPAAKRGADVLGVDSEALSIAAAASNAERLGFSNARFAATKASEMAQFLKRAGYRPEVAILDPPRMGAKELMPFVAGLRPRSVLYVSCNTSTLVRDLRPLLSSGYSVEVVKAIDFFPNTHHAEVVVKAVLT